MITILDGKLTIPEKERFIGFAGDNLYRTIEFLLDGVSEESRIYRIYLTFDDGTVNYFVLPSRVTDKGVVLTWQVELGHIFKSGLVRAQIKVFSDEGVVYHTTTDTFVVGDSTELSDTFLKENSEFLEYEEKLNSLSETVSQASLLMPVIGDNGNWFIFDSSKGQYVDSGHPSVGRAETSQIADGAVTKEKLADSSITTEKLAEASVTTDKLHNESVTAEKITPGAISPEKLDRAYPEKVSMYSVYSYDFLGSLLGKGDTMYSLEFTDNFEDAELVGAGVSYIGFTDNTGMVLNMFSTDTLEWYQYMKGLGGITKIPVTADYLSIELLQGIRTIDDEGDYFLSDTVEGALQEIGETLSGLDNFLSEY